MPHAAFDIKHAGISVYEALTSDISEKEKARIIAEAIDGITKEFPNLKNAATLRDLSETELRLTKEIEETRKEIKKLDLKLSKEIEEVKKETKNIELKLSKEIEEVKKETKGVELRLIKEIKTVELKLTKEIKEVELKLTKDIKELDLKLSKEIEETKKEIKNSKIAMLKWQFIFWISQITVISGVVYKLVR